MSRQIIGLHDWFQTPAGQYLLRWEDAQLQSSVADIFGYHALQLGVPQLDGLRANRMPHQWLGMPSLEPAPTVPELRTALVTDYAALPFSACSLDLVVLPHTLELSADPHTTLREVERVLVPEGRVVICGLNPVSLWGLRQRRAHALRRLGVGELFLPDCGEFIGYWRLRDWLRLLGFEVEESRLGCYRPAVRSEKWLERWAWMDAAGSRWWPILGAAYFVVAVKRVRGMRLLGPAWKTAQARVGAPVPAVQRNQKTTQIQQRK
ncbi:class I SAM-dependent methyltransferase [Rhodoferax sp.]|uniref:class I SAM-dependent methyltransferase n=1 Tax=Rhodoferax sp. TaxID=50421 RepID=UPI002ACEFA9D|nr:methyltransferase domain-containing protein [Rhodoferax sp.]MDZ7920613.1 methyltransferase domain-containing protein [Rhodoferax sp.]